MLAIKIEIQIIRVILLTIWTNFDPMNGTDTLKWAIDYQKAYELNQHYRDRFKQTINQLNIKDDWHKILKLNIRTEGMWAVAVEQEKDALYRMKTQTEFVCDAAVQHNGFAIHCVKNPIDKIRLAAIKQHGLVLECIENPTDTECLVAVQQNGLALQYVKDRTPEICLTAVQQNGQALQYVKDQTFELCLAAVQQNGLALQYVNMLAKEICLVALKQNKNGTIWLSRNYIHDLYDIEWRKYHCSKQCRCDYEWLRILRGLVMNKQTLWCTHRNVKQIALPM